MTKQDETHRVMFTLTDQAIAKLDQLVAKKQQEVNQNPDLAKKLFEVFERRLNFR